MDSRSSGAARRELAFVLALATGGIALVLLLVLAPWYDPVTAGTPVPAVVQTYLSVGM